MSVGEQTFSAPGDQVAPQTLDRTRSAPWLFGSAILLAAFLLFLVQPILGKMILPWFGGGAGVWAACLLYFQASLLAGYAYAHVLRRWAAPRWQMRIHVLLLAASLLLLPILPSPEWRRVGSLDPAIRILGLLTATVGLPYLLVASTSPLLQAWYAAIRPGASAYRFYALSNLGSLLGLVSFPALVEPRLASRIQGWGWSSAYVLFALLCAIVAWYALKHRALSADPEASREPAAVAAKPSAGTQILWIALAACGAALMMATTNFISQNLAPIPLLWILPLSLYLLSFVFCFEMERIYQRWIWMPAMLLGLSAMAFAMFYHGGTTDMKKFIPAMLAGLFACCMVCHGELARHKPEVGFLTYFYLLTSAGGVLGGFFVAIVAPRIFRTYMELPLWMVLCVVFTFVVVWKETRTRHWSIKASLRLALLGFAVALTAYITMQKRRTDSLYYLHVRNFYGMLQVEDMDYGPPDGWVRSLVHGTIEHGAQLRALRHEPTLYYLHSSGIGIALGYLKQRGPIRVGAIGLGAGVLASYCGIGDVYRFYDINPAVVKIARSEFTFLRDCHGQLDVTLGDARLSLESQVPQEFDLLAVDAFSGDAIPVHLLTKEAVIEYFRHLKSNGILAIHVSNKYLDLVPIAAGIADSLHKRAVGVYDDGSQGSYPSASDWILVTGKPEIFDDRAFDDAEDVHAKPGIRLWTDDYSNLLQILELNRVTKEEDEDTQENKGQTPNP